MSTAALRMPDTATPHPTLTPDDMIIRPFTMGDRPAVVALWHECELIRPWNDPHRDIARKLTEQADGFLVGTIADVVMASMMVGYDGHRGWVYYLAVSPAWRLQGIGRRLMDHAETMLIARGCAKINLMVRSSNARVLAFYESLGYQRDEAVALGKRLIPDQG